MTEDPQQLFNECLIMSDELRRMEKSFQDYRDKAHEEANETQIKITNLELENFRLKQAIKDMLDFNFGSISAAKKLLDPRS
jgi:hypothetical protein